jgi:hypothetical protein
MRSSPLGGYNTAVPGTRAQASLVLLLVGLLVLTSIDAGAMRLGGVSLAWWYAAIAGPLASAAITLAVVRAR